MFSVTGWLPLRTERLLLREFRPEDEDGIYAYASDPEVVRFADWGPSDVSTIRANLQRRLKEQEIWPRNSVQAAVELVSDSCLIGIMRITIVDEANRTADFGYTFNRLYWNKGYATEAAQALLGVAFSDLNLHRVWATCDVRNRASWRVMEKLGMRREGHFKKDIFQKGEWRDSYLYAILAEEWRRASSA
jgi:[ribosomal protein S5]-alanine N-acetyltransferase